MFTYYKCANTGTWRVLATTGRLRVTALGLLDVLL